MFFVRPDGTEVPIRPQLAKAIVENSNSKILGEAVGEWYVSDYAVDYDCDEECVCGQQGLFHLYGITNLVNGNELFPIGSECILKFGDETEMAIGVTLLGAMQYSIANKFIEMPSRKKSVGEGEGYFSREAIEHLVRMWHVEAGDDFDELFGDFVFWGYNPFLSWFNHANMSVSDLVLIREWYLFEGQAALCRFFDMRHDSGLFDDIRRRLRGQYLRRLASEVMLDVVRSLSRDRRRSKWSALGSMAQFSVAKSVAELVDRSAFPIPVAKFMGNLKGAERFVVVSDWAASRGQTAHDVLRDGVEILVDVLCSWHMDEMSDKFRNKYVFVWRDVIIPIMEAIVSGELVVDDMEDYRHGLMGRISSSGASRVDAWETSQQRFFDYVVPERFKHNDDAGD